MQSLILIIHLLDTTLDITAEDLCFVLNCTCLFCSDFQVWTLIPDSIYNQTYTVLNLRVDTHYLFVVRAQNSHGFGLPSSVSAPIKTKGNFWTVSLHVLKKSHCHACVNHRNTEN